MKKIITFSFISFFLIYLTGCMEDKGNYDYIEINAITVDLLIAKNGQVVEYEGRFTVGTGETLVLSPSITQTLQTDESNLSYCWWAYESAVIDTLSLERDCNYLVNKNPGVYTVVLIVTDTSTGITAREFDFTLTIVGPISNGVMILSDVDGIANVGFLSASGSFTTDMFEKYNNGAHAGTNPVSIAFSSAPKIGYVRQVYIFCDDATGGSVVSSLSFEKGKDYQNYFYIAPDVIKPEAYFKVANTSWFYSDFFINNGRLHSRNVIKEGDTSDEAKFSADFDGDYYMSKYAFARGFFYDNKHYRFYRVGSPTSGTVYMDLEKQLSSINNNTNPAAITAFDPDNVGLEMLFLDVSVSSSGYAIMREPNDPTKLWRLKFNAAGYTSGVPSTSPYVSYWKEPILLEDAETMGKASAYTISKCDPYIYYSSDNFIYRYDVEYGINRKILDINTIIPNSQVDYVYIQNYYNDASTDYNLRLYAASSEKGKSGKNGSIYSILLDRAGEVVQIDAIHRNVVGRVVSMDNKF